MAIPVSNKFLNKVAIVSCAVLAVSIPTSALAEWDRIGYDDYGRGVYVENTSVKTVKIDGVYVRYVYARISEVGNIEMLINCRNRRYVVDGGGDISSGYARRGTVARMIVNEICNNYR